MAGHDLGIEDPGALHQPDSHGFHLAPPGASLSLFLSLCVPRRPLQLNRWIATLEMSEQGRGTGEIGLRWTEGSER